MGLIPAQLANAVVPQNYFDILDFLIDLQSLGNYTLRSRMKRKSSRVSRQIKLFRMNPIDQLQMFYYC